MSCGIEMTWTTPRQRGRVALARYAAWSVDRAAVPDAPPLRRRALALRVIRRRHAGRVAADVVVVGRAGRLAHRLEAEAVGRRARRAGPAIRVEIQAVGEAPVIAAVPALQNG